MFCKVYISSYITQAKQEKSLGIVTGMLPILSNRFHCFWALNLLISLFVSSLFSVAIFFLLGKGWVDATFGDSNQINILEAYVLGWAAAFSFFVVFLINAVC